MDQARRDKQAAWAWQKKLPAEAYKQEFEHVLRRVKLFREDSEDAYSHLYEEANMQLSLASEDLAVDPQQMLADIRRELFSSNIALYTEKQRTLANRFARQLRRKQNERLKRQLSKRGGCAIL